jgi:hypothetical protein
MSYNHHTELAEVQGLPLDTNSGSFSTYASPDGMRAIVVEWRTGKACKRFKGETAHQDAERWAYDLHVAND